MIMRLISLAFAIVFLLSVIAAAQTVKEDRIAFTTPDAPWMVSLDGKNLELKNQQIKDDNKSGYFLLFNEEQGITVSLFIEPAVKCKTSAECRDFVWNSGNPKWGKLQDVVHSKIGDVSYFEFFRPMVQNLPLEMFDMYAQFVEDGYWVDLHISKVKYKKEDHLLFENLVKSVKFTSKNGELTTDKSIETARTAAENWMLLWDSGKYKESYAELSSSTKKVFDEKTWSADRVTAHKSFGKLKSRKIIQIQLIKSLPYIPDSSGAIFWYLSSYENQEKVFESFSVILGKDGTWRVANYNTFK
jgi:hypothetical protein